MHVKAQGCMTDALSLHCKCYFNYLYSLPIRDSGRM
jgi:hypothetical protein